ASGPASAFPSWINEPATVPPQGPCGAGVCGRRDCLADHPDMCYPRGTDWTTTPGMTRPMPAQPEPSSFQALLRRLENLSDQFRELREGIQKAVLVADLDPEMALTRCRKMLEFVVREVYERRSGVPSGTRDLDQLIKLLVKDGHFSPILE